MTSTASPARIDVRTVVPHERHTLIFSAFDLLEAAQALELVNDHDPQPLYRQFEARLPGKFSWDYLETGPGTWRVAITKLKPAHASGQCCGSCGGA